MEWRQDERIQNYINGVLQPPLSGNYLANVNPATGEVYNHIPDSDSTDIQQAYEAAQKAFPKWSTCGTKKRYEYLIKISKSIQAHLDILARAESIDNGKPIGLSSHIDIPRARDNFEFFATAVLHFSSESHHMEQGAINYTLRRPIGVVGCISPWNLPLYLFTWKIAPALATGNCVVAKPSEVTPLTAYLLSKICVEAGLPPGVLNIIPGRGPEAGQAIIEHPDIKAISFTGGTATGRSIARTAAPMFKKLSLELGGKNPNIIFADCDYDEMLKTTVRSSFANNGQICLCGSRIYVEESLYETFVSDFTERVKQLHIGDPLHEDTEMGAVVSESHMKKILGYIALAKEEGGTILTGGKRRMLSGELANGFYVEPTVIVGLSHTCKTNQEEIFGPVVTIEPFKSEQDALHKANSTVYGLSSTIWTSDLNRAHRMAEQIQAGIVWINCWLLRDLRTPFGGVKKSGVGREGGLEALRFFTEQKNVCIKY